MELSDVKKLSEFLVRIIDEESLSDLNIRRDLAGSKYCCPWKSEEILLSTNAPELEVPLDGSVVNEFLKNVLGETVRLIRCMLT